MHRFSLIVSHHWKHKCFSSEQRALLPGLSEVQIKKIENYDNQLRMNHSKSIETTTSDIENDLARRKRMIYRSKQRGWLEADILMGSWAAEYVPNLSEDEMDDYESILNEETINVFNYITKRDPLPSHLLQSKVMKHLQDYSAKTVLASPQSYEFIKSKANLT